MARLAGCADDTDFPSLEVLGVHHGVCSGGCPWDACGLGPLVSWSPACWLGERLGDGLVLILV